MLILLLSFILFGAADVPSAFYQTGALFGLGGIPLYDPASLFVLSEYWPFYLLGIFAATPVWGRITGKLPEGPAAQVLKTSGYLLILLLSISYLAMGAHNPFIYFNF